ncbi:tumor necrosis factor receptor superfamily member 14-like [Clytia hemisphaerica]|uniref:Uncharacterized protein n=1 Tax=Clytia hemisphaerica TaxID=252671 RepID=A0A7M5U2A5_9CNID
MDPIIVFTFLFTLSLVTKVNSSPAKFCHPGYEVGEDNKCRACQPGYYSKNGTRCKPCTKCHKGQTETHKCEPSRNTLCLCGKGLYERDGICKECTDCPAGMFQKRDCGHNLNRLCESCPQGHYTNHTNTKKCIPKVHTTPITPKEYHYHTYDWKLIISLVALVSILCIILAIIVYYVFHRKRRQRNRVITNHANNNHQFEEEIPLNFEIPDHEERHQLMENIPYSVFEDLAMKLNPEEPNNWRKLASHLGFSLERIRNIALTPNQATQELLNEWVINPNSTAFVLHNILTFMNRPDAAAILEPHLYREDMFKEEMNSTV